MRTDFAKRDSHRRRELEHTALECQIAATDAQIDSLVYDLDRLTEDEIKIVEGATA